MDRLAPFLKEINAEEGDEYVDETCAICLSEIEVTTCPQRSRSPQA